MIKKKVFLFNSCLEKEKIFGKVLIRYVFLKQVHLRLIMIKYLGDFGNVKTIYRSNF